MQHLTIANGKIWLDLSAGLAKHRCLARHRGLIWLYVAAGFFLSVVGGFAASITWGAATTISGDTDVYTNGTALYAYYWGSGNKVVNGVTFTASSAVTPWGNISFSSGFSADYGAFSAAAAPFTNLSSAYQAVLTGGDYGASPGTVTLNGLTIGHSYSMQIWISDPRSCCGAGRTETISGTSVTITYQNPTQTGGVGQYSVGTFVANSTSQSSRLPARPSSSTRSACVTMAFMFLHRRLSPRRG